MDCKGIFRALDGADIPYCHWKSNEHILAGLQGRTDLDVYIPPSAVETARAVLRREGWLLLTIQKDAMGTEDWLGFSEQSGSLFHIHLHTVFPIGSTKRKIFTVPAFDPMEHTEVLEGVRVINAHQEQELLIARIVMKSTLRQVLRVLCKGRTLYPENIIREVEWLSQRVPHAPLAPKIFSGCSAFILKSVHEHIREGTASIIRLWLLSLALRVCMINTISLRRLCLGRIVRNRKKTIVGRGGVFAFIGVDGSGKTTLTEALAAWAGWKLSVRVVYLGLPKKTFLHRCIRRVCYALSPKGGLFHVWSAIYRVRQSRSAARMARRGTIVLTDRYPLPMLWHETPTIDGPRAVGVWGVLERKIYTQVIPPTESIYVRVSLSSLIARDTHTSIEQKKHKFKLLEEAVSEDRHVTILNGESSREEALLEAKKTLWKKLYALSK